MDVLSAIGLNASSIKGIPHCPVLSVVVLAIDLSDKFDSELFLKAGFDENVDIKLLIFYENMHCSSFCNTITFAWQLCYIDN